MTKVTLKDIAKASNVSTMTVSNVINGRTTKASPETVRKIMQAVTELGYTPNMSARSLVSNSSRLVGVVVPFTEGDHKLLLDNPFYAELVSGIELALRQKGYNMILSGLDSSGEGLDVPTKWNVDALIMLGMYKQDFTEGLQHMNVPKLLIDSYVNDDSVYQLRIDDEQAAYLATSYLIEQGHRNIAHVTGLIRDGGVVERRYAGYCRALNEAGIELNEHWVYTSSVSFEWGREAAELIHTNKPITAVFCSADLVAAGLMSGLHQLDCDIPGDISVVGFDNLSISRVVYPALTTVDQGILRKGQKAGQIITSVLANEKVDKETIVDISFVERDSVKTIRSQE